MNASPKQPASDFDQIAADTIARNLWIAFNNIGLYGADHPLTKQGLEGLQAALNQWLSRQPAVVLHVQQDQLHCEDFRIEPRNFGRRLMGRITDAGIQSVSFLPGIQPGELVTLIQVLNDPRNFPSVDTMGPALEQNGVTHIRLNSVHYQMVLDGQVVVDESVGMVARGLAPEIEKQLDSVSIRRIAATGPGDQAALASTIATRVQELRNLIDARMSGKDLPASSDEIIVALSELNRDVGEKLRLEKASGKILDVDEKTLDEADRLTYDTVVRIVREEYQGGRISTQRLSRIIRRLLPEVAELKRLLPKLKEGLLGAGMSEKDYLELMEHLAAELEQEGLTELLEGASENAGLSVREVLDDIKKNPEAVVQLTLLSAEIQSMTGMDNTQMQALMAEYIDRVTTQWLLKGRSDDVAKSVTAMQEALSFVQEAIMGRIAGGGADPERIKQLGMELSEQVRRGIARVKAATGPAPDSSEKPEMAAGKTGEQKPRAALPKGVLGSKGIKVFLDREIKRHKRYRTPLSCLCLSVLVSKEERFADPPPAFLQQAIEAICDAMSKTLRDLDLIGSLGSLEENLLLVILSMTDEAGAQTVKKRLSGIFEQIRVHAEGGETAPLVLITVSAFNPNATPDLPSLVKQLIANHRVEHRKLLG